MAAIPSQLLVGAAQAPDFSSAHRLQTRWACHQAPSARWQETVALSPRVGLNTCNSNNLFLGPQGVNESSVPQGDICSVTRLLGHSGGLANFTASIHLL